MSWPRSHCSLQLGSSTRSRTPSPQLGGPPVVSHPHVSAPVVSLVVPPEQVLESGHVSEPELAPLVASEVVELGVDELPPSVVALVVLVVVEVPADVVTVPAVPLIEGSAVAPSEVVKPVVLSPPVPGASAQAVSSATHRDDRTMAGACIHRRMLREPGLPMRRDFDGRPRRRQQMPPSLMARSAGSLHHRAWPSSSSGRGSKRAYVARLAESLAHGLGVG